jgi:hypothetical protein
MTFTESILEESVLDYLASQGWQVVFGPQIAPLPAASSACLSPSDGRQAAQVGLPAAAQVGGEPAAERGKYREVLLEGRLR